MSNETAVDTVAEPRSGRPELMPWVTPYLMVRDVPKAVDFYESAFGFGREPIHFEADGTATHASMTWRDSRVMMGIEGGYGGTTMAPATTGSACPISIYIYCDDVDALARRAVTAGAEVKYGPIDTFYGDRICNLADPEGYVWCFATHLGTPAAG